MINVDRAAAGNDHGLAFDDEDFVLADGKTNRTGNLIFLVGVQQQLNDENPFQHIFFTDRQLGSLGHDAFVGFAVDHDLPFTGTHRGGA